MRPGTAVRLALAGTRTDTLRVGLTGVSAAMASVAMLSAATVLAIRIPQPYQPSGANLSPQYQSDLLQQPGLRPGVASALILLCIPVLALAVQCSRLGAPARDRRLAAFRLAGATPAQTLAVVTVEAGLATLLGTLAGLAIFLGGRQLLDRRNAAGELWLPTDVLPPAWAIAAICAALPAIASLLAALLLRRVRVTPFGVVRQVRRTAPPRTWPAIVLVIGVAAALGLVPLAIRFQAVPTWVIVMMLIVVPVGMAVGVIAGTGSISYVAGAALRRWGRAPSTLLAGGRLMADPWNGSRVLAALLAAVLIGGISIGFRSQLTAQFDVDREAGELWRNAIGDPMILDAERNAFYTDAMDLVDLAIAVGITIAAAALLVAAAESLVSRRRAYAALVATGVPRGVIGRSIVWQLLAPALPAVLVAATSGWLITRSIGHEVTSGGISGTVCLADTAPACADPANLREVDIAPITRLIPVPLEGLLFLTAGATLAVLTMIALSMLFLRSSTSVEELRTT
ncbi:FtsX-like permease family protein [Catenuloplanes japonicus]|uniref:FtsX-like permease family protein n=1 Tax=Catenuloplanes japonicus TaxID=33876 RepID=UPI00052784B3|nr:FtsX-like permease family protein [Catenuloplanes japonicus]